jgi:hypothetical protein
VDEFIAGLITMGFAISALFFLRFWTRTGDALFAIFAGAFALLALNQGLATLIDFGREELGWVYLLRLAAFLLIIIGIVHKNVVAKGGGGRSSAR